MNGDRAGSARVRGRRPVQHITSRRTGGAAPADGERVVVYRREIRDVGWVGWIRMALRLMRVVYSLGTSGPLGAVVCAVSTFDGVHGGHLALARRALGTARAQDSPAVAVVVWEGERAEPAGMLTLLDERLALLAELTRFNAALVLSQAPGAAPLDDMSLRDVPGRLAQPVAQLAARARDGMPAVVPGSSRSWTLVEDVVGDAGNANDYGPVLANTAGGEAYRQHGQMRVTGAGARRRRHYGQVGPASSGSSRC